MAEWKLFEGPVAPFTDSEFYRDREAAHHLEQGGHTERMVKAAEFVKIAYDALRERDFFNDFHPIVVDLGCGDGGMLQLLRDAYGIDAYGYDMQPSNIHYATTVRNVKAFLVDFQSEGIITGDITIMTEVLEHVSDPHGTLAELSTEYLIASSPFHETGDAHYEFHNWAFDDEGYDAMIVGAGFEIVRHEHAWLNQVVLARRIDG